jgi:hypothetical protein
LKPEWRGSPLAKEKYYRETVIREIIIITIILYFNVLTQQLQEPITESTHVHNTTADAATTVTQLLLLLLLLLLVLLLILIQINIYNKQKHVMRSSIGGLTKIKESNSPCEQSNGKTSFR